MHGRHGGNGRARWDEAAGAAAGAGGARGRPGPAVSCHSSLSPCPNQRGPVRSRVPGGPGGELPAPRRPGSGQRGNPRRNPTPGFSDTRPANQGVKKTELEVTTTGTTPSPQKSALNNNNNSLINMAWKPGDAFRGKEVSKSCVFQEHGEK